MANEIELGGKLRRIRYDYNALADLEQEAGASTQKLFADENNIGFNTIRLLVWSGLRHEERGLTTQRVGLMLGEYIEQGGELATLLPIFIKALRECKVFKKETKNVEAGSN